jgi:hypothetical protein
VKPQGGADGYEPEDSGHAGCELFAEERLTGMDARRVLK